MVVVTIVLQVNKWFLCVLRQVTTARETLVAFEKEMVTMVKKFGIEDDLYLPDVCTLPPYHDSHTVPGDFHLGDWK